MSDGQLVAAIAREHLPAEIAGRWLQLLRPAAALCHAGPGARVAAVLGGQPRLPHSVGWPAWEDHGPLSFVAAIDCAALAAVPLDITLPQAGALLFFYFDGQYDNHAATIGYWDPATLAGARMLYAGPGEVTSTRACPDGIEPYERVNLAVEQIVTFPGFEHPDLQAMFKAPGEDLRSFLKHPVNNDGFGEALHELRANPFHQVGGYATPVQGPVEYEAAMAAVGGIAYDDPRVAVEQARWTLLIQIDSDDRAGMMWGDCGALYWLSRREDLADGHIGNTSFTWQCA